MAAIELLDFSFSYPAPPEGHPFAALSHISLAIGQGSFSLLAGMTGSGKSTLMRCLKAELAPPGQRSGRIQVFGQDLVFDEIVSSRQAADVGYVMQDPEAQIVTDSVWHELAFGLENIGSSQKEMHRRVAETASFFGITSWFEQKTASLSGGQKQLLNLASVMVMQPRLLLLDEPTAQLDPLATREFLGTLQRVNQELGVTVLIIEHNLEEVATLCDQVVFLADRTVDYLGSFQGFIDHCIAGRPDYLPALPSATQLAHLVEPDCRPWPLTVRAGREWLEARLQKLGSAATAGRPASPTADTGEKTAGSAPAAGGTAAPAASAADPLVSIRHAWFAYERTAQPVLRELRLDLQAGQIYGIVGTNGSGKSTLLSLLAGLRKPQRGHVRRAKGLVSAALPQDPKALFTQADLWSELADNGAGGTYPQEKLDYWLQRFRLQGLQARHPYDLSGGEQQKAALIKLLLRQPQLLLLDEPTKGLDAFSKAELISILNGLSADGQAIVIVTHDLDFVAAVADSCSMLFNGNLVGASPVRDFFSGNLFYTTAIYRITRGFFDHCVRLADIYPYVR